MSIAQGAMFAPVRVGITAVSAILLEVFGLVLSGWCLLWLLMELPVAFAANDRFPPSLSVFLEQVAPVGSPI